MADDYDLNGLASELGVTGVKPEARTMSEEDRALSEIGVSRPRVGQTSLPKVVIGPRPSYIGQMFNQAVEGMPIIAPLVDKAVAAGGAMIQPFLNRKYEPTFGERYRNNLSALQAETKREQEEHPIMSPVMNLMGGITSMAPLAMTPMGAAFTGISGPSMGWRMLTGGLGGGVIGGTDAVMRGENPITGATIGIAGGAAGPAIGEGAHAGTSAGINYLAPKPGPLRSMDPINVNRLMTAIEGETPATLQAGATRAGPYGFLGDISPGLTDLTGAAAATPGVGKALVISAYRDRMEQQAPVIKAALDRAMGPRTNVVDEAERLVQQRKIDADPLYDQWRNMEVHPTDEIKALMPRLKAAKALGMAQELAGIAGDDAMKNFFTTGPNKKFPTTASWDYIKQALDRRINAAYQSEKGGPLANKLIQLKRDMLDEIEKTDAGKVWVKARRKYAEPSALIDQLAAGRDTFLGGRSGLTVDELRKELSTLSVPELKARIQGMRDAVGEAMGASLNGDGTLRGKLLAQNNQDKIRLMLGNTRLADDLIDTLKQQKFLSEQYTNIVPNLNTGASTVSRGERKNMLMPEPAREWGFDVTKPVTYMPPSWREQFTIAGLTNARRGDRYSAANNQLAHILTMPQGPSRDQLIQALQDEAIRQATIQRRTRTGGNLLSGVIGVPGTTMARRQYLPPQ